MGYTFVAYFLKLFKELSCKNFFFRIRKGFRDNFF